MKIFKLILVGAVALSGYIGYGNFVDTDIDMVLSPIEPIRITESKVHRSIPKARSAAKERLVEPQKESSTDYVDLGIKIGEILLPLIVPMLIRKKRKTLDNKIADVAEKLGIFAKIVRGKLGLDDRRKNYKTRKSYKK